MGQMEPLYNRVSPIEMKETWPRGQQPNGYIKNGMDCSLYCIYKYAWKVVGHSFVPQKESIVVFE